MINVPTKKVGLLTTCIAVLLSGCAHQGGYTGTSEYYELASTHVVERDLTQTYMQPTLQNLATTTSPKSIKQIQLANHQLGEIFKGEPYRIALNRWLHQSHYSMVGWSLDDATASALDQKSPEYLALHGTLISRVAQLGIHLEKTLVLTTRPNQHLAAVHQFKTRAFVSRAHGTTLKAAIHNLVTDYGYQWGEDGARSPSYRASDDYAFAASYPIVTQAGNIKDALATLLDGYPVQAQLLTSTGQVFIEDNK